MLDAHGDGGKRDGGFILAERKAHVSVGRPSGTGRDYEFHWYEARADPQGPPTGTSRVSRGGAFDNTPFTLRCARRDGGTPESRDCHDGFRVVRE
jgi:formylglycine-generating enzyme required for sulfatase activity